TGVELALADPDPLAERDQVRRQVGAGAQAVVLEDRGDHPYRRGLAVRSHDVDRLELPLGMPERGHQPQHPVQAEAHPEQLAVEDVALGLLRVHSASSSARSRARSARALSTTSGGALSTNPWF